MRWLLCLDSEKLLVAGVENLLEVGLRLFVCDRGCTLD
jgi:hypothetical protein